MKVAQIKTGKQFSVSRLSQYKIQAFGEDNAFPQALEEIVLASKTGRACIGIYQNFVYGAGFSDKELGNKIISPDGVTANKVLRRVVKDYAFFNGFALHINYNANGDITSIAPMDFSALRLCLPNDDNEVVQVAFHPDWGHRDRLRKSWKASDIEYFDVFNPDPEIVSQQVERAGGWDKYKGQVLYINAESELLEYPTPMYIAEVTDMRTEEGLANVTGRNVCSNFLPAGMVVEVKDEEQDEAQLQAKQSELESFQGDENVGQLWYTQVKNKDQMPEFLKFTGENYDSAFSKTQEVIPENIGQAFMQPPILRAVNVGAGFGADLMTNAYTFYNSITEPFRGFISEVFARLLNRWCERTEEEADVDASICPLVYNPGAPLAERVGDSNITAILDIVKAEELTDLQKRNALKHFYGLTDNEVYALIPNKIENTPSHVTEPTRPAQD